MTLNVVFGAGPMGRAIARQLLAEGERVRVVTRSGAAPGLEGAEAFRADVMLREAAFAAAAGATTVFHAAAPAYGRWVQEFPRLQDNIVAAAAQAGAVLAVVENLYGYGVAGTLHERLPLDATTRKGRVRAEMTARLLAAHAAGTVRAVAGRAADYFGPEVRVSALGERAFPALLAGKTIGWIGDPDVPHSFTYVPDFAAALIRLARTPSALGRAWHVPSPPPESPRTILTRAAALAGVPVPRIRPVPLLMLRGLGLFNADIREVPEMAYSFTQPFVMAHSDYDAAFGPGATGWDKALRATVGWWRGQNG